MHHIKIQYILCYRFIPTGVFNFYLNSKRCSNATYLTYVAFEVIQKLKTNSNAHILYIEIVHHYDKSMQLDLNYTTARSTKQLPPRLYPNNNDPLCPVKYLTFFCSNCCPEQQRVFCKLYNTKQMKQWRKEKKPYLYKPNLWIGENKIDGINKDFAKYMGFTNWERCTNHSTHKLGITNAVSNADKGIQHIVAKAS